MDAKGDEEDDEGGDEESEGVRVDEERRVSAVNFELCR